MGELEDALVYLRQRGMRSLVSVASRHLRELTYNLGYRLAGSIDGYPFPPSRLVRLVIGSRQIAWYQLGGMYAHRAILRVLRKNAVPVESFTRILDFGCGCGRLIRHWAALRNTCELWGCDYNLEPIEWCRRKLSDLGRFEVNRADPPLDFIDDTFDLVYSYSVFTHLSAERQKPWVRELRRVLKPGGYLLVTVHGMNNAIRDELPGEELGRMERGELVVVAAEKSGTNACVAYHSEGYVRKELAQGLTVVDFLPCGMFDATEQDIYLFRK